MGKGLRRGAAQHNRSTSLRPVSASRRAATAGLADLNGALGVLPQGGYVGKAIGQAFQKSFVKRVLRGSQRVKRPLALPACHHQTGPAQIREMARGSGLGHINDLEQIVDAPFLFPQQVQDAQSRLIRESPEFQIHAIWIGWGTRHRVVDRELITGKRRGRQWTSCVVQPGKGECEEPGDASPGSIRSASRPARTTESSWNANPECVLI